MGRGRGKGGEGEGKGWGGGGERVGRGGERGRGEVVINIVQILVIKHSVTIATSSTGY